MVHFDMGLISEVQSITSHPDGAEVQVKVVGPKNVPAPVKSVRARARALMSEGPIDSAAEAARDAVFDRDLHRLTSIRGQPTIRTDRDFLEDVTPGEMVEEFGIGQLEARLYTIIVRED